MDEFLGKDQFIWFFGVVEDRNDPLQAGRVRVRCFGHHTEDKKALPISHLPWAAVMQPTTSAAASGMGSSPSGLVEGSWVVGWFLDGKAAQRPLVIGSIPGIPQQVADTTKGFNDPRGNYPLYIDEPDTSRLARNENISQTIVQQKDDSRATDIPVANSALTWSQPFSRYNAIYPYNKVFQSESGHVIEIDDSLGSERLHTYHRSGTFEEIISNGTRINKVIGDDYTILERHGHLYVKGNVIITVDGDANVMVKNNLNADVWGDANIDIGNDLIAKISGSADIVAKERIAVESETSISLKAPEVTIDTTTLNLSQDTLNVATDVYNLTTTGDTHYYYDGDVYTFIGADTYARHDIGVDYNCPSDPERTSTVFCGTVEEIEPVEGVDLETPVDRLVIVEPVLAPLLESPTLTTVIEQQTLTPAESMNLTVGETVAKRIGVGVAKNVGNGIGSAFGETTRTETVTVKDTRNRDVVVQFGSDALAFLKLEEGGPMSKPYRDAVSYSVGYGHYLKSDIVRGYVQIGTERIPIDQVFSVGITREQSETLFKQDVAVREEQIRRFAPVYDSLAENQKVAILSYYYNTGRLPQNFQQNASKPDQAAVAASLRNGIATVQGKTHPGLVRRRKKEAELYESGTEQRRTGVA